MTRTEADLRAMYADLANEAAAAPKIADLVEVLAGAHLARGQQPPRPGNRARRTVTIGVVAAAAVAAALLVPAGLRGIGPTTAAADPVTVLRQAASHARAQPDVTPRPDQFYYVKADGSELWLSIDGTHDGLQVIPGSAPVMRPGCRGGLARETGNYAGTRPQPCTPDPAYLPDVPSTAAGMLAFLRSRYGDAGVNGIGKGVFDLLQFHYLRPAARAAVFDALTQLPGLHTISTPPVAGRPAIGVTWSTTGADNARAPGQQATTLIFDKASHSFMAIRTTGVTGEGGGSDAPPLSAVVDRAGQRP
jgi:hypothetical protein